MKYRWHFIVVHVSRNMYLKNNMYLYITYITEEQNFYIQN